MDKDVFEKILENEEVAKEIERFVNNLKVINDVLESIKPLVESGAVETLVGLGYLGETIKAIMSEEMISSFSKVSTDALELIAKVRKDNIQKLLSAVADHDIELEKEVKNTRITGFWSLLSALKDEDVQKGLTLMLAYLKLIGRYAYPDDKKE